MVNERWGLTLTLLIDLGMKNFALFILILFVQGFTYSNQAFCYYHYYSTLQLVIHILYNMIQLTKYIITKVKVDNEVTILKFLRSNPIFHVSLYKKATRIYCQLLSSLLSLSLITILYYIRLMQVSLTRQFCAE